MPPHVVKKNASLLLPPFSPPSHDRSCFSGGARASVSHDYAHDLNHPHPFHPKTKLPLYWRVFAAPAIIDSLLGSFNRLWPSLEGEAWSEK